MVEQAQSLRSRFLLTVRRRLASDAECGKMFAFRSLCRDLYRAWCVELEPESSPFVAFAMKLETTDEPLSLKLRKQSNFCCL